MKKIIPSLVIIAGMAFIGNKANAQVSSDKPAMTQQQVTDLLEKRKAEIKAVTEKTAPVNNAKPAAVSVPSNMIVKTEQPSAIVAKATVISDQGGVKPIITETPVAVTVAKVASAEAVVVKPSELKLIEVQEVKKKD